MVFSFAKIPALIHSSRRSRMVVAEQVQSAIDSYEPDVHHFDGRPLLRYRPAGWRGSVPRRSR